ncbi:uncharacterized protein GO595_009222 [Histomonas meleagridis]|uniref:uncharacterized protein n=1 Tax=Histomonas meleagridis TaxID=135588 RepID=UPI00355AB5E4|nr:hypothetical protein GO595_009222 [Histomonas meleagridis]
MDSLPTEPPNIEAYQISRPFPLYSPDFVEQYQLSSFSRTDTTTFIAAPIAPPEKFPYVKEEQPIFERVPSNNEFPEKEKEKEKEKEIQQKITNSHSTKSFCSLSFTFSNILNYPRSTQYYSFDPSYSLIPQIMEFPDLQNEIGKSSILSLPTLEEYEKVSISKSSCVAPFAFAGVPDFFLSEMSGPESIDLKELENDDDVDGIDVTIKTEAYW